MQTIAAAAQMRTHLQDQHVEPDERPLMYCRRRPARRSRRSASHKTAEAQESHEAEEPQDVDGVAPYFPSGLPRASKFEPN